MTKKEIIEAQSQFVAMRNDLIRKSRYSLSLTEQRMLLLMISKITPYDEPGKEYPFTYTQFREVCNLSKGGNTNRELKAALTELKTKPLVIPLNEDEEVITNWFNDARLNRRTGEIMISFSKYLTPYLYELQRQMFYTQFNLSEAIAMKSTYGIRLLEYLKSIQTLRHKEPITLYQVRALLGCEEKYPLWKDFRVRVLEPAINDVNTYSDIFVEYEITRKQGKKVLEIQFSIKDNDFSTVSANRRAALEPPTPTDAQNAPSEAIYP